jgi:hypothetical protein
MFCRSLFVLLYFFFWPLCCLFYFDIWFLIASNSSYKWTTSVFIYLTFIFLDNIFCLLSFLNNFRYWINEQVSTVYISKIRFRNMIYKPTCFNIQFSFKMRALLSSFILFSLRILSTIR